MEIYVRNLSYDVTEADLSAAFSACAPVARASVITDRETGRSRGFGFVQMADDATVAETIAKMDGQSIQGRTIACSEARPRAPRPDFNSGAPRPPRPSHGSGGPPRPAYGSAPRHQRQDSFAPRPPRSDRPSASNRPAPPRPMGRPAPPPPPPEAPLDSDDDAAAILEEKKAREASLRRKSTAKINGKKGKRSQFEDGRQPKTPRQSRRAAIPMDDEDEEYQDYRIR